MDRFSGIARRPSESGGRKRMLAIDVRRIDETEIDIGTLRATQVEIAVFRPDVLATVRVFLDGEGRCLCFVEDLQAGEFEFDVAGGAVARTDVDLEQDDAFDAKTTCGCNVFKAVGGKLLKRRGTFYVTQFTNTDADAAISIDCDRLVFGGDGSLQPFVWTKPLRASMPTAILSP